MSPAPAPVTCSMTDDHFQVAAKKLLSRFAADTIPEDRLTFVRRLGAGEFGTVDKYDYLDKNNIKTALALKLLNRDLLANDADVNNFVNEMRTLKKLTHPCIAAYVGCGTIKGIQGDEEEPQDLIFMAQECCEGVTLQDVLTEQMSQRPGQQAYQWSEVVSWMIGICSGLQYMHESKPMVMHRDLKPANIVLVDDGNGKKTPKLVDFGLHKVIHLHSDESIRGGVYNYALASRNGSTRNGSGSYSLRGGQGHSHRGSGGSRRGPSATFDPSAHSQSAAAAATLPLSALNDESSYQQVLGRNGSVHAKNNFAGIQGQVFQMTGGCGSLVYMAPEVHKGMQYNHMVDVFSVALIFWELFAFRSQMTITDAEVGNLTYQAVNKYTMDICCGLRPPLPQTWPKLLRSLFADMWHQDYAQRPSFAEIVHRLKEVKVVVEQLESKNKCPTYHGVLPGMRLQEPKKSKEGSVIKSSFKSLKSFFKG